MSTDQRDAAQQELSLSRALVFAAASAPVAAISVPVLVYLPPYLASHLGVPLVVVGAVWGLVRMLDLFVDPVLAIGMDQTRTRLGRYRAWMIAGGPILMLGVYQLFLARKGVGAAYLTTWLLVLYLGTSVLYLAHSAWSATLAKQYDQRSRLFALLAATGIAATVAVLLVPIATAAAGWTSAQGVQAMGLFVVAVTPLAVAFAVWRTPERIAPDPPAREFRIWDYTDILIKPEMIRLVLAQCALTLGPVWMSSLYLFFFAARGFTAQQGTILLIAYILSGVAGAPSTGRLAKRYGKHRTLMMTTTAFSIGLFFVMAIPKGNVFAALPVMLWCGFMASGFDLMLRAMVADVGDDVRLAQGKERTSLLFSLLILAQKVSAALAIVITYPLLARLGYKAVEGAVNTHQAIVGLEWTFLLGPTVFVMLGGACLIGWKLDAKRHAEIRAKLDARDAEFDEAPIVESITGRPALVVMAASPDKQAP